MWDCQFLWDFTQQIKKQNDNNKERERERERDFVLPFWFQFNKKACLGDVT